MNDVYEELPLKHTTSMIYEDEIKRLRQQNTELVKVLKEIADVDMFDDECKPIGCGYLINKARAAIAKATGGE